MTQDRPALFLDRDGVIVAEVEFLHRIEDGRFMPGLFELTAAPARGYVVIGHQPERHRPRPLRRGHLYPAYRLDARRNGEGGRRARRGLLRADPPDGGQG